MAQYELTLIFGESSTDDARTALRKKLDAMIKKGGGTAEIEEWGKRQLAHSMNDNRYGYYLHYVLECPEALPNELTAQLRLEETVVRFMLVSKLPPLIVKLPKSRDGTEGGETIEVTYKNIDSLTRYVTERGKIVPGRVSRLDAKQQRALAREIKRSRMIGLMPFTTMGQ